MPVIPRWEKVLGVCVDLAGNARKALGDSGAVGASVYVFLSLGGAYQSAMAAELRAPPSYRIVTVLHAVKQSRFALCHKRKGSAPTRPSSPPLDGDYVAGTPSPMQHYTGEINWCVLGTVI